MNVAELGKEIASGRVGTPAEVARVVALLAAEQPSLITRQHIVVDGFPWEI